jgi:transposase
MPEDDCDYKVVSHSRRFPGGAKKNNPMNAPCLGIDIAQLSFVAALWFAPDRVLKKEFPNHGGGFRQLGRWLKTHGVGALRAAVESTNTYADALAQWLHDAGHRVYLLNPERVSHYARSLGQCNKTDPADAVTIALFIARHEATPWTPLAPEQKTLRSLTRARHQLVEQRVQLTNQLRTVEAAARPYLQAVLDMVRAQLLALAREITRHLHAHPALWTQVRRLMTMKGVGLTTAAVTIAELPPITAQSDPRTICGWAGLVPRRRQSGRIELPARLSRKGNVYLRRALYMPALVAKRHNPLLRAFALRLEQNGKTNGAILGAVAHKMLRILVGLLRSNTDFDPNWSHQKI